MLMTDIKTRCFECAPTPCRHRIIAIDNNNNNNNNNNKAFMSLECFVSEDGIFLMV